jgi:alpha-amylase
MKHTYACYRIQLLFLTIFLLHLSQVSAQMNSKLNDIVYEVYVQSFCDSNGDGIGDLPGLISKLDYIKDLGATTIWMMPVHPSPSYHKYDILDYYAIHPDFGTMADMDQLIAEATKREMKLILDLVINHTSAEHPWFVASSSSPESSYRDYYVWKDFESVRDEIQKKTTTFDSDNLTQWHAWEGQADRYYGFFWKGMPDLNFDHPPVRKEIYKIGKFWLDKGIDGFRLDAAKHIYPDDRLDDTRKFWEEFTTEMRAIKPDVKIIGEVWSDSATLATLFKGLPSLFNFELTKNIPECIHTGDGGKLMTTYTNIINAYKAANVPFEDAILLSNHDMNRIRSTLGGDIQKSKLAASILLTLPGTPYIYYGEEIGMMGVKPDIHLREPFPWGSNADCNTTWDKPVYSVIPDVAPLDLQKEDPASIYHHYKKWIRFRTEYPELANGVPEFKNLQNNALVAYTISGGERTLWVIHNLSNVEVTFPFRDEAYILSEDKKVITEDALVLPAYSSALIRMGK